MVSKAEKEKRQKTVLSSVAIIAVVGLITVLVLYGTGVIGSVTPVSTIDDEYTIVVTDLYDSTNTDDLESELSYLWYSVDTDGMTESEIEDLTWADFSADGTGDDKDPEADYIYICRIYDASSSDIVERYVCTDGRIFEGKMPVLSLGENTIGMANFTEDVSMVAWATDGGVTVNQTNFREWNILWTTLDASEGTGSYTRKEGYSTYFDPTTNKYSTLVVKIQFNTTASTSWADLQDSYTNRETDSGNYLYIEIDVNLQGHLETELKFSSALGTDFEVIGMSVGYGNADSNTLWDTQY